ncbi:MAG: protein translocase subunit SecD [Parcubacteria group bacterium]|nr:protein translocase subunit SecD [Parcubacteria group bacterium]
MKKRVSIAFLVLIVGAFVAFFVYSSENPGKFLGGFGAEKFPFSYGLDISGGTHLVYKTDVSALSLTEQASSIDALRDVIERRVNLFGVAEPIVQIEKIGFAGTSREYRLLVELPGVTDIAKATAMIGQTPVIEFKTERPPADTEKILAGLEQFKQSDGSYAIPRDYQTEDPYFVGTNLTGRFVKKATLQFDSLVGEPTVSLEFNDEGAKLFADMTKANVGKPIAIYLDGAPISTPVVREEITGGQAQITGKFTPDEAKLLVGRLNSGALPVPIELMSTEHIGPSLGKEALADGVRAGLWGVLFVILFLILWYRLPGLLSVVALGIYTVMMLAIFKLIPVTLTSAGIAGFIMSIGMAVDANILIFERTKEELQSGKTFPDAIESGFARAWLSIRDSNLSSIITAVILFWFGTSLVQGFALTFGIGVVVSMLSSISITRSFMRALFYSNAEHGAVARFLFGSGTHNVQ